MKLARLYTKRQGVIAFEGAFHGRTWMALDDDVQDATRTRKGLGRSRPRSIERRTRMRIAAPMQRARSRQLEQHVRDARVSPEHVAAIVFEPQQGEGGFVPAPAEFVAGPAADLRRARHRPRG